MLGLRNYDKLPSARHTLNSTKTQTNMRRVLVYVGSEDLNIGLRKVRVRKVRFKA